MKTIKSTETEKNIKTFNKIDALKYLIEIGPEYTDEYPEASMYNILCEVIRDKTEIFDQEFLDEY